MGICYRAYIFDEFNWDYVGFKRETVLDEVKRVVPHAELLADIPHMMVFDIDKSLPYDLVGKVTCDLIMEAYDLDGYIPKTI
jgi:hypothetical protein